jgi:branched-chain amino acid transport system permease protein
MRGILLLATLLALVPAAVTDQGLLYFITMVLVWCVFAIGYDLMFGLAGLLSFGHAAFFGIGAYCSTILQLRLGVNPWLGLPASVLAGALAGGLIALLSFRAGLKGSYFALITLAFAEAFRIVANSLAITGGGVGLLIPMQRSAANFQFPSRIGFYYVIAALAVLSIAIALWLKRSRFGARLAAIRENEDAARALGIDALREKVKVMALSGGMCAAGGTFYAQYFLYIDPAVTFGVDKSVEMLLVTMIGGAGTVYGPLIGSFLLTLVGEVTRNLTEAQGLSLIIYGCLLVVIIGFLPNGLADLLRMRRRRRA